ncbi:MAG TPA: alpha/beta hydrolase [Actinocatenispora sp.]
MTSEVGSRATVRVAPTRVWRRWDWAKPVRPAQREVRRAVPSEETTAAPLLFVPDLHDPGAAAALDPWLAAATDHGRGGHALSPRGMGATRRPGRRFAVTRREWVHDVVQEAVALPRRAVLVGHGTGAWLVAHALHRYPAAAAVLIEPVGLPGHRFPGLGPLLRRPRIGTSLLLGRDPARPSEAPPLLVAAGGSYPAKSLAAHAVRYGARGERLPVGTPGALPDLGPVLAWLDEVVPARQPA